jgi:hypothetical protein
MRRTAVSFVLLFALAALSFACSGDSDSPGDDDDAATTATTASTDDDSGDQDDDSDSGDSGDDDDGGASGGRGQFGSVVFEINGPVEADGELPFIPAGSFFADGAWYLTFGDDDGDAVIVINLAEDGTTIFYGNGSETVVGVGSGADKTCDVVIEKQDEDGATGSFDCEDTPGTASSGATFASGISMKGRFEARSH